MIRPALPEDTPALKSLTAATGVFKPSEVEVLQGVLDDFHGQQTGPDHVAVVDERDGQVVGYAYYAPDVMTDRTWYLYWIAVSKTVQARGIGSGLAQLRRGRRPPAQRAAHVHRDVVAAALRIDAEVLPEARLRG